MRVEILQNSVKFYLPRLEAYFEGKIEPVKYTRVEVHTNESVEDKITDFANKIRINLNQTSLAYEFNNHFVLVSE